jgi:hypothetical protein
LDTEKSTVSADANVTTPVLHLPIASLTQKDPLVFVRLEMRDEKGALVEDNFYWIARDGESYRGLNELASASIDANAVAVSSVCGKSGNENVWNIHLKNAGTSPSVAMKLTLFHADNTRVLPTYYSDNYISLLPGEERTIAVHAPSAAVGLGDTHFTLRGWNLPERDVPSATKKAVCHRE